MEADSQMYQSVGWHNMGWVAEALGLPLYQGDTAMEARSAARDYTVTEGDEVEDLVGLLEKVVADTGAEGVTVGAILSDYQRVRVESVCLRLGLTPLAFLWRREQAELLEEMVGAGVEAVLVKVACLGLEERHLGLTLAEAAPHLATLAARYGANVCGEGGEFESFTLDCPLYRRRLAVVASSVVHHSKDPFAPVCLLQLQLEVEGEERQGSQQELLGEELISRLHPSTYAATPTPLPEPDAGEVEVEELDLRSEVEAGWRDEGEGWFTVKGCCGRGEAGEAVVEAFTRLQEVLGEQGATLDMLVKVLMYVDTMANYLAMNKAYVTHFGLNPPVRVCVGSGVLPPGARVVLGALGHLGGRGAVLHVQGVSHWAPANIGPYSQGVLAGGRLVVSGQIGLVPGTMALAEGVGAQAALALRHVVRVGRAMAGVEWADASKVICYVVDREGAAEAAAQWRGVGGEVEVAYRLVGELPRGAGVEWEVEFEHRELGGEEEDSS